MSLKCIEVLMDEHKTLLRVADVLDAMVATANQGSECEQEDVQSIFQLLRVFGDDCHQAKEEGALYPVFAGVCDPQQYRAVRHMLFEHDQDRSLIEGMEDAIRRTHVAHFAEYANRLTSLLRNHIYKENNILFERISEALSNDNDQRVISEFEAFDREFETRHKDDLMRRLLLLERKYLRKMLRAN
jgi:hemerythrin-like domain-containing protein